MAERKERATSKGGRNAAPTELELHESNISLLRSEHNLLVKENEALKSQLSKYKMAHHHHNHGMDHGDGGHHETSSQGDWQWQNIDYEFLSTKLEQVMTELDALRTKQEKTVRECEQNAKEADYYKKKYKAAYQDNQDLQSANSAVRADLTDMMAEKEQLEVERDNVQHMSQAERHELDELRRQVYHSAGNAIYDSDHLLENFMESERENFQQRYDALSAKYKQITQLQAATQKRCETAEKEAVRYRRCLEVAEEEKALMSNHRNSLKQQLNSNIKEWENSLQEKNAAIEKYKTTQEQLKRTTAELNKFIYAQHAVSKNMSRLQEECSNAVHDHKLIMSERDIVLRDMSKLEDERDAAVSKLATTEADLKGAQNELETLRREISSALNDRDKALKECHDMKEKLDLLEKDPLRTADREKANALIEDANRQVEKFREEMLEAQREAEIATKRREFAFIERDKSMMERESIKMLCETFRQERDKAISDLAEVARQCDEVKRRRMQLAREANELRERLDSRRIPPLNNVAHNHSHDSAIDTDFRRYGSDSSEGENLPSSPVNVRPVLVDAEVQTDISDLSRNNSTLRQKKFADSKSDKASWRKSLFEPREKSRPRLDDLFDIDVKASTHTTMKTKLPSSGRDKGSILDRAVGKLFGRRKDVFAHHGSLLTGDEGVAIAKLESVVQRYDSPNGTRFYTKTKIPKMPEKLPSGTWPKIKGAALDSFENIPEEGTVQKEVGKGSKVRKSIQSLTMNGRNLIVKDIPLDDDPPVNMSPSLVNRKVPLQQRPEHRFSMQPTTIYDDTGSFTPRTPPSRRQMLSVFPEKADDAASLSSFVADFTDSPRGRPNSVYPSSTISEYSGTLRRPPSAPLRSYLPTTNEMPPRLLSPATNVGYSTIQPRSSTFNPNLPSPGPRSAQDEAPRRPTALTASSQQQRSYAMNDTDLYSYPRNAATSKARHPSSEKSSFSGSLEYSPLGLISSPLPSRAAFPLYDTVRKRPLVGKVRVVELRCKNGEHPGFKITECHGGIFVDKVEAASLADKEGIVVGDQVQDVNGVSLLSANATKEYARLVLKAAAQSDVLILTLCYCGPLVRGSDASITSSSATSIDSLRGPTGTLRGNPHRPSVTSFRSGSPDSVKSGQVHEARWVKLTKGLTDPLGVNLIGGNVHGIFIHYVQSNSAAAAASSPSGALSCGDQILEYNAVDMRSLLLEKAMLELCKPVKSVAMLVQYNPEKYEQAKQSAGDALFVRALWDRDKAQLHDEDLVFQKGDILFIDNTLYNGEMGQWKAWLLDDDGHKLAEQVGIVPNVYRAVEEVLSLSHIHSGELHDSLDSHRRSARLSFGKLKKKKALRREIASFTNASLGNDVFSVAPEEPLVATYERVNKVVYEEARPVVILGPFGEEITEKLLRLHPDRYGRCMPAAFSHSDEVIEKRQYSQMVSGWQSLTVGAVRSVAQRGLHPLLDVSISSVEKMVSSFNLYPIVLVVKFRNAADIRDVRDSSVVLTRISSKEAKELFELALRVEMEHSQVITSIIPGGSSLSHMVTTADRAIEAAQTKPKWISEGPVV